MITPLKSAHEAIMLTRSYLHAHYASDLSLETLAAIAGLSRFHSSVGSVVVAYLLKPISATASSFDVIR